MSPIHSEIEIAAPPTVVREKFLDFDQIPSYHPNGFIKFVGLLNPTSSKSLEKDVKLHVVLDGMTIDPVITENTPTRFSWLGKLIGGNFNGEHIFRFEQSTKTSGGTTFIQEEAFSGFLAFIMGEGIVGRLLGFRASTLGGFEKYNKDLKKWCEES